MPNVREREVTHQGLDAKSAWISTQRRGDVSVGVGVAVQHRPEQRSDDRQVAEVDHANQWVGGSVEIQRVHPPTGPQHSVDLTQCAVEHWNIAETVPNCHEVEVGIGKREGHHVADDKRARLVLSRRLV